MPHRLTQRGAVHGQPDHVELAATSHDFLGRRALIVFRYDLDETGGSSSSNAAQVGQESSSYARANRVAATRHHSTTSRAARDRLYPRSVISRVLCSR